MQGKVSLETSYIKAIKTKLYLSCNEVFIEKIVWNFEQLLIETFGSNESMRNLFSR